MGGSIQRRLKRVQKKDLPKALVGHSFLFVGGVIVIPSILYVTMFLIEPLVVFGFGAYLIWLCLKKKP